MSAQMIELLSPHEALTSAEVNARFTEVIEGIDQSTTPEDEERLNKTPVAKVNGKDEEFGMWDKYK